MQLDISFRRESIPKIKTVRTKVDYLTKEEVSSFYNIPDVLEERQDIILRNKLFILTCFVTGVRASEALDLKFSDVTESDQIPIQGKMDKHRAIYINDTLRRLLLEYKAVRDALPRFKHKTDSDYIFISMSERDYGEKL